MATYYVGIKIAIYLCDFVFFINFTRDYNYFKSKLLFSPFHYRRIGKTANQMQRIQERK